MPRPPHETKAQVAERERLAWSKKTEGWTDQQIADLLGITRQSVVRIIARVHRKYASTTREEVAQVRGNLRIQTEYVIAEALQAWRESKRPQKRVSATKRKAPAPGPDGVTLMDAGQVEHVATVDFEAGDPEYLDRALRGIERLAKLYGVDQTPDVTLNQFNLTHNRLGPSIDLNVEELDAAALGRQLAGLADAARVLASGPLLPAGMTTEHADAQADDDDPATIIDGETAEDPDD